MPPLHTFPSSFSPPLTRYYDLASGRNLHSPPAGSVSSSSGFEPQRFTTPPARSVHSPHASASFDTSRFPTRHEERIFSPPRVPPPQSEFHPRLYPGSVRHASRTMAVNRPSYYPAGPANVFEPNWRKIVEAETVRDAKCLEKEQPRRSSISIPIAETPVESVHSQSQSQEHSPVEQPQQSPISIPVAETPVESVHLHSQSQTHSSAASESPSFATASSPTFSALAHSPASGLNDVRTFSPFFFHLYHSLSYPARDSTDHSFVHPYIISWSVVYNHS